MVPARDGTAQAPAGAAATPCRARAAPDRHRDDHGGADRRVPADPRRFAGAPPALQRDSEGAMR
jgi:hypothetical protein